LTLRKLSLWASCGLVLYMLLACNQVPPLIPVTESGAIIGEAEMRRGGTQAWARVRPETILYVGDSIRALKGTRVAFLDGTILDLAAGTQTDIIAFKGEPSVLHLKTNLATFEISDAAAHIQASEDAIAVQVDAGQVDVLAQGRTERVGKGQSYSIGTKQAVAAPGANRLLQTLASSQIVARPPRPTPTGTLVLSVTPTASVTPLPMATRPAASPARTPKPPSSVVIRVNCGGPAYQDTQGNRWAADQQYTEGSWGYVGGKVYTTGNEIAKTDDDLLYQSERWGNFFYLFDIPNGTYQVTFYFAEIYRDAPGIRKFSVRLEGHQVLSDLDLVAVAGRDVAHVETFTVDLMDGQLGIEFKQSLDNPKINALSISAAR